MERGLYEERAHPSLHEEPHHRRRHDGAEQEAKGHERGRVARRVEARDQRGAHRVRTAGERHQSPSPALKVSVTPSALPTFVLNAISMPRAASVARTTAA